MTLQEALEYCRLNNFSIFFTPAGKKGTNTFHIMTPWWYAEKSHLDFASLIEFVKLKVEAEATAREALIKEHDKKYPSDRGNWFPSYNDVMKYCENNGLYTVLAKYRSVNE